MNSSTIKLSDHFTYGRLFRYVIPSIGMMLLTSLYYVVDGYFVSNYVGKIGFAAVNLLIPTLVIPSAFAFMLSAGGAALVGKTLGEGDHLRANRYFSMLIYLVLGLGVIVTILAELALPAFIHWMGADGELYDAAYVYGWITLLGLVPFMMQVMFQALWAVAEKPTLGLYSTIASGVTNLVLDYLWIVKAGYGIEGAAVASIAGQFVGGLFPLIYFGRNNSSLLRFVRTSIEWKAIVQASMNGASEMMTSISASVLGILFNLQLMAYIGADGVAAYGVLLYANGIFDCIYFGFGMGVAPLISYQYGAGGKEELQNLFRKSMCSVGIASLVLAAISYIFVDEITYYFVGYDEALWQLTKDAFILYCISFLFLGLNNFGSAFFTALNNGKVSATISFARILLFQTGCVLLFPCLFGIQGIWWSVVAAEVLAFIFVMVCLIRYRHQYQYWG